MKRKSRNIKRINYLTVKKNQRDKFEDIIQKYKHLGFTFNKKKGETVFSKVKYHNLLSKELGINKNTLKKYFAGNYSKRDIKKINKLHKGFEKIKKISKEFTKNNFTFSNFFHPKTDRLKKHQQYYFRAGIQIIYTSKDSGHYIMFQGKLVQVWIMPNVPVSHFDFEGYPKGYRAFYEKIKHVVHKHPSFLFFVFNYLDVSIVDMENYNKILKSWK